MRAGRLQPGKLPIDLLESTVLRMTGRPSKLVATPPKAGLDFAAIKTGKQFLVISADPITGVAEGIGEYAVKVSANDVATSGNRPQFAETVIMLPERSAQNSVREVAGQIDSAARKLGIAIVGGHTEVTPGLRRPIVVVTAFSFVSRYVSSGDARSGDAIMMTKTAGIEGTAVLSGLDGRTKGRRLASEFMSKMSVVDEAVGAFRTGHVRAMHDCTEGGVLGGVFEMAVASRLGFELHEKRVPVARETRRLCARLSLDPLRLVGSGALLLAVKSGKESQVERALKPLCSAKVIGRFSRKPRVYVRADGRKEEVF
ncbi:MAG: hydrogenase [Thaumarchaeota archaeon]|nr:hydrogenase [Nitrososphaerota archaeon]